jgi:hypothetical protein
MLNMVELSGNKTIYSSAGGPDIEVFRVKRIDRQRPDVIMGHIPINALPEDPCIRRKIDSVMHKSAGIHIVSIIGRDR